MFSWKMNLEIKNISCVQVSNPEIKPKKEESENEKKKLTGCQKE